MTKATARTIDALTARAFPVLLRMFALAAAVTFVAASARLMAALAAFHI